MVLLLRRTVCRDGALRTTLGRSVDRLVGRSDSVHNTEIVRSGGLSRIVHVTRSILTVPVASSLSDHNSLIAFHKVASSIKRLSRSLTQTDSFLAPILLLRFTAIAFMMVSCDCFTQEFESVLQHVALVKHTTMAL